jgi:hypothetical protein
MKIQNSKRIQIHSRKNCGIQGNSALQLVPAQCTYRCISKQMHYKTPFSHNGYMKSLEFYENYITLFCKEKNKLFELLY